MLLGLVAFVLVVILGAAGFGWLLVGRSGGTSGEVTVTADMPIVIGDKLHMQIDNHGCEVEVEDVLADGRLMGVSCGARESSPLARSLLTVDAFPEGRSWSLPEAGDVVLWKAAGGWERRVVVGPEPGKQLRVRPLVDGKGKEEVVAQSSVVRVQSRAGGACWLQLPIPEQAPLVQGDHLDLREGTTTYGVTVQRDQGATVEVEKRGEGVISRRKTALSGRAICTHTAVQPDTPVLVKDGGGWLRRVVVADEGTWLDLKDPASGASESRAKHDMINLRPQ